jgi:BirA family biotin operon repressor/biotin-[acetyl-CoA-carboxylase] ligase
MMAADRRLSGLPAPVYHAETGSTNDDALALASAGAPEGTAVIAGRQTAGRGRHGREWFSPPDAGLYVSVVARPPQAAVPRVTLAAGIALARAVGAATALPVELKWPNDLVIGRPWRKLAGVLCETSGVGGRAEAVVIGAGLNIRSTAYPPELAPRATSLEAELGRDVDRDLVIVDVLAGFAQVLRQLHQPDLSWIRGEWLRYGRAALGATVTWHAEGMIRRGVVLDLGDDGALRVDTPDGPAMLRAGEVTWERVP